MFNNDNRKGEKKKQKPDDFKPKFTQIFMIKQEES